METYFRNLSTFEHWPKEAASSLSLARANFQYTGEAENIKCQDCGIIVGQLKVNQDPFEVHRGLSPQCPGLLAPGMSRTVSTLSIDHTTSKANKSLAETVKSPVNHITSQLNDKKHHSSVKSTANTETIKGRFGHDENLANISTVQQQVLQVFIRGYNHFLFFLIITLLQNFPSFC